MRGIAVCTALWFWAGTGWAAPTNSIAPPELPLAPLLPPAEIDRALQDARFQLEELRKTCKDNHPKVIALVSRISDLETQKQVASQPQAALALAKARLEKLRATLKENHPAIQQLQKDIKRMEASLNNASR